MPPGMKYLLIDDERDIRCDVVVRAPEDGLIALKFMGPFEILYLDHDMGLFPQPMEWREKDDQTEQYEGSGYGICCFLEAHPEYLPETTNLVTGNPSGLKRMAQVLSKLYPYTWKDGRTFSKHEEPK